MLGRTFNTDKSPYNVITHRHPYTAVYSMLFASLKNRAIRFAEIGVARGGSAQLWDTYFTHSDTKIEMFDRDSDFLQHTDEITSNKVQCSLMDVQKDGDIARALKERGGEYDVIIDDSTHGLEDQVRIVKEAFPLLKPGGILIVEDIFRATDVKEYETRLKYIVPQCSASYFVICEHMARWSPGWDNDKLLVLVK
jgi:predicted O-methyltransferase YrrM